MAFVKKKNEEVYIYVLKEQIEHCLGCDVFPTRGLKHVGLDGGFSYKERRRFEP